MRAWPGHDFLIHKFPSAIGSIISFPFASTIIGSTPGKGRVAYDGLVGVIPAREEIRIPPVSVCHHVSTIGQFSLPIFLKYQSHASSFIGSPTVPNTESDKRDFPFSQLVP